MEQVSTARRRIGLNDLRHITPQEHQRALQICQQIEDIVAQRADYIQTHQLDPEFALPMANWNPDAHNDFYEAFRLVLAGDYQTINHLRFYTQAFTGHQLMTFSLARGKRSVNPIPEDFEAHLDAVAPMPDAWVSRYSTITEYLPAELKAMPPWMLGEIGWEVDNRIVNHDTYAIQERLNLLYEAGILNKLQAKARRVEPITILEIGGGYGALAYHLKRIIPSANYIICDLPESLLFAGLYLRLTCPHFDLSLMLPEATFSSEWKGFALLPNFAFDTLAAADLHVDLAINTLSFAEMSEAQIRHYAQGIHHLLADDGVLFEQNHDNTSLGLLSCKDLLAEIFAFNQPCSYQLLRNPTPLEGEADLWANNSIVHCIPDDYVPEFNDLFVFTKLHDRLRTSFAPRLIDDGYQGFNVVELGQVLFYGLAHALGPIDLNAMPSDELMLHQAAGQCVIGRSPDEVRHLINGITVHANTPENDGTHQVAE